MKSLRWILTPPRYANSEKSRHAEILHYSSIFLIIAVSILYWFNLKFGSQAEKSANWMLALIVILQFFIQWLIRSDYVNQASLLILTLSWAVMTEISRDVGGVRDVAILGYVLIMFASGYLLGWRVATFYTLATITAIWGLAYLEETGHIVPDLGNPYRISLDLTVVLILMFLIIYYLSRTLTKALEDMQQALAEKVRTEKILSREQERLHLALNASSMGIWNWEIASGDVSWSEDVEYLFGMQKGEFDGRYETYLSRIHPDDLERVQQAIEKALSGELTEYIVDHRALWPNGETRWLEGRGNVYLNDSGQPVRMTGTVVDITTRKQADEEREYLIQELAAKNKELEQFTYTVSHDLKAPLITINGFLGYLAEDIQAGDSKKVQQDIKRVTEATSKMRILLDELLELSRIGRMMNPPENIPFEEIVQEALELVEGRLSESKVEVRVGSGFPSVWGDRSRLVAVVQNLLDNAVKYMGDQPAPIIEIGQQGEDGGKPVFFVRDNGIGIASQHHESIFGLFKQLDANSEGTGVGLALVKRILEFHGGRIWVESEEGKGATFYFALPKQAKMSKEEESL